MSGEILRVQLFTYLSVFLLFLHKHVVLPANLATVSRLQGIFLLFHFVHPILKHVGIGRAVHFTKKPHVCVINHLSYDSRCRHLTNASRARARDVLHVHGD